MQKYVVIGLAATLAATGLSAAPPRHDFKGSRLAASATVTMEAARKIALSARPGVITDQELERERGGSGLRYSFDIRSHGRTYEVGVDARTGALLENGGEGPNPD